MSMKKAFSSPTFAWNKPQTWLTSLWCVKLQALMALMASIYITSLFIVYETGKATTALTGGHLDAGFPVDGGLRAAVRGTNEQTKEERTHVDGNDIFPHHKVVRNWSRCPALFEDEFLIPLVERKPITKVGRENIVLITDFYLSKNPKRVEELKKATKRNMQRNAKGARFAYIVGSPKCGPDSACQFLQDMADETGAEVDIYWAPGGATTYQHMFSTAMFYPGSTYVVYHSDISLGNVSKFLPTCNLDKTALIGSRSEMPEDYAEDPPYPSPRDCSSYKSVGSYDVVISREDQLNCNFLFNLKYAPYYWGAENVLGSQIQQHLQLRMINVCPDWKFHHLHQSGERNDTPRIRINGGGNSFSGKTTGRLSSVCKIIH